MIFDPKTYTNTAKAFTTDDIEVDIVQIYNIAVSKLRQLDEWRDHQDPHNLAVDRVGSSRIIRSIDDDLESLAAPRAIYKLLLRDTAGNLSYAYEYNDRIAFLHHKKDTSTPLGVPLGGRLVVKRGTLIMNGVLMLKNAQCHYLGPVDGPLGTILNSDAGKKQMEILQKELETSKS